MPTSDQPPSEGPGGPAWRQIALPGGRSMVVRPTTQADVEGLSLLYAGLCADDVHLRFFAAYHPPRAFFERLASAGEEGRGYGLVAVVDQPVERIVGEATYFLLENGNGELAVTVAPDWRGWLGPYLLDALIGAAGARGVPNLEAEILVENRRMLALIRRRGYAVVDGADFSTIRVSVGTSTATPTWPEPHDHARVLVEIPGGRWRNEKAVRRAGLQVMVCPGPHLGRLAHCPALDGAPCPLAQGADVILCELPSDDRRGDEVRAAHASVHPGIPVLAPKTTIAHSAPLIGPDTRDDALISADMSDDALIGLLRRILNDRATPDAQAAPGLQPPS